ncbi:hypothetical protein PUN28_020338 [Cardiocondyla obscurior]|uniref:Uncharacterized protein n=1 Tax=Cardiocondyla obscurior TaxID=286306 RepID=A0AAW2E4N0_9HYME
MQIIVHLELCKVSKLIYSAFGVQMAWEIGIVIISIIQTLYNFYNHCIIQVLKATLEDTLMAIILSFIGLLKVFFCMQQFGIQILQSPVTFYLFGMTMDNHILSMILKNVTTYMVIIVQVESSLESNNDIKDIHFKKIINTVTLMFFKII